MAVKADWRVDGFRYCLWGGVVES